MKNRFNFSAQFWTSFSRSQIASALATAADYAVLFGLTEYFHVWYVISVALGALAGGITNFLINRHWSFQAHDGHVHRQALRYTVVSGLSLLLNTLGVWGMTEYFKIHYSISVVIISLGVGFFFNFPLHRSYVFR
jgi:putative flippase GtrA